MQLNDIITSARTRYHVVSDNKKRVLQLMSNLATVDLEEVTTQAALDAFISRERLGSTAVGHGVAIPHGRLAGIDKPIGVLIGLKTPIVYDEEDKTEVDLLIGLLVPADDHETYLDTVADIAKQFRRKSFRERLRNATSDEVLYKIASAGSNGN